MRECFGRMWLALFLVVMVVASGGSAAISQSSPATSQGQCSGDACLALATKLERQHDYLGARDTLRTGCSTGSVDACIRLALGDAYILLFGQAERGYLLWEACLLGDFKSCEMACELFGGGGGYSYFVEETRKRRQACPDPKANLHACQKLEELELPPPETARSCGDLEPGFIYVDPYVYRCPHVGPLNRCELRAQIKLAFSGGDESDRKELLVALCKRGSAWACITGAEDTQRGCSSKPCALDPEDEDDVFLVEKTKQLCKDGVVSACLLLGRGGSSREMKKRCEQGHKAVCDHLISDSADPFAGEAACRHGDVDACDSLMERVRGDATKLSAFFARMCAANFESCLDPKWYPAPAQNPMVWKQPEELIVRLRETTCPKVVLHARSLAGVAKPTTDPEAERFCQARLSPAAQSCIIATTDRAAMAKCTKARTSSEVVREQAEKLAEAAGSYFEHNGRIPTAPPFPKGPPCCGASCRPPAVSAPAPDPADPKWVSHGFRSPRWVQLDLRSTERELIASASGDWDCDGNAEVYEARWSLINGKVSRITTTARP